MPRQSRIDAPGAVHHIIVRGIARRAVFRDDHDRDRFIDRLGTLLIETETRCFAWALIPNHVHLLLRTGRVPVANLMRRLLTGHAVTFNRRHKRYGHLFQNRYKSILCQEETYLGELVRYIHLNPLRAKIVEDMRALDRYPYSGHSVIMGMVRHDWQEVEDVLARFGKRQESARKNYRTFVVKGIDKGRRPDLVGGGLIRSAGGWEQLKAARAAKIYLKGDERILGDSDFVEQVLARTGDEWARRNDLRARGFSVDDVAERVSEVMAIPLETVWAAGRYPQVVRARSLLCYWAVRELAVSMSEMARRLGVSLPAVSKSVRRGEEIARAGGFELMEDQVDK